jgi:hypothetical protein
MAMERVRRWWLVSCGAGVRRTQAFPGLAAFVFVLSVIARAVSIAFGFLSSNRDQRAVVMVMVSLVQMATGRREMRRLMRQALVWRSQRIRLSRRRGMRSMRTRWRRRGGRVVIEGNRISLGARRAV